MPRTSVWCFDITVLSLHMAHSYVSIFDSHASQKKFFSVGEKWQHLGTALLPVKRKKEENPGSLDLPCLSCLA